MRSISSGRAWVSTAIVVSAGMRSSSTNVRQKSKSVLEAEGNPTSISLIPEPDEEVEEAALALRVHRAHERLVPVAEVGRAPGRRAVEDHVGPGPVGEVDGRVRAVAAEVHRHGGLLREDVPLPVCAGARRVYVRRSLPLEGKEQPEREQAGAAVRRMCALGSHTRDDTGVARTVTLVLDETGFAAAATDLASRDPALAAIVERHGLPEFWAREPGLETLVLLILEQQVSLASARAAYERLVTRLRTLTTAGILASTDEELRADGFSRQKTRYVRALATAIEDGALDLAAVGTLADDDVRVALVALPGIGPWTAEVYLLSALRRPDTWPVGDIALQEAARRALGLGVRPTPDELERIGEPWRPHRASAARLLWHLYLSEPRRSPAPAT